MMATQTNPRIKQIQTIWEQYQGLYVAAGIFIGLLLFPFLELVINDLSQLLIGLLPEAIGIGFTVFFLDRIYQRREIDNLKKRLVREAGSTANMTAKSAVDQIRKQGWWWGTNSILTNADLEGADLSGARLSGANLIGATFLRANLSGAYLRPLLPGVDLRHANLEGVQIDQEGIHRTRLENTDLREANLEAANLEGVILYGADLYEANLHLTNLFGAQFDIETRLPDGSNWEPGTDITKFGARLDQPDWWPF